MQNPDYPLSDPSLTLCSIGPAYLGPGLYDLDATSVLLAYRGWQAATPGRGEAVAFVSTIDASRRISLSSSGCVTVVGMTVDEAEALLTDAETDWVAMLDRLDPPTDA